MKTTVALTLLTFALFYAPTARADSFGSGANQFTMEFVPIGNPGNPADATGSPNPAGSVWYAFNIGKSEVSRDMITKANASIASGGGNLGITLFDMTPYGGNEPSHPATGASWNEAARFVNWLNTSQGYAPAYKFTTQPGDTGYIANQSISLWVSGDAGFNPANPFRNSQAHFFLPSVDEWYKAAYYDPGTGTYFDYPTGSNSAPSALADGTTSGTAVHFQSLSQGPADVTLAGGLSPYGTMGQGGNVWEWEESEYDLNNSSPSARRGFRGGGWGSASSDLRATLRGLGAHPSIDNEFMGFRVASIPEPRMWLLGLLGAVGLWLRRRMAS
jgi:hypothetical protein